MSMLDGGFNGPRTPSRNRPHGNLNILRIAVFALFAILAAQLVHMQIVKGEEYARRSEQNHITRKDILPVRGVIYDRDGNPLVENVGVYTAVVTPVFLPSLDDEGGEAARYRIYQKIEEITGTPALETAELVKTAEEDRLEYLEIAVAKYLTKEQALRLDEASTEMPGVQLAIKPGRNYVGGTAFSHILGYVSDQRLEDRAKYEELGYELNEPIGREGVEAYYESELRGTKGYTEAEQNAEGTLLESLGTKQPVPGNDLVLAIDMDLQTYVEELLGDTMVDSQAAAAVVMSPKTGEVYALVTLPGYDNNWLNQPDLYEAELAELFKERESWEVKPLLNQALVPQAPGSTFKLITAAAALQEGNITPSTFREVSSMILEIKGENGQIYDFKDWRAHGGLQLREAIAVSSNIYMYMASCGIPQEGIRGLGKDSETSATVLAYYARAFGLGPATGIDIGGEFDGLVPDPRWKREAYSDPMWPSSEREWYYADTCFMGIGQYSVTASPLQIATMTAAVANGGQLLTPHVLKEVRRPDGTLVKDAPVKSETVPVDPQWLQVIREGMRMCATWDWGACGNANKGSWPMAGKTGTAEYTNHNGHLTEHAWFTGFAPYDDPEVVVTVYFETGWGGTKAAPVAGEILKYFEENVAP
ncbi:MAG: penicillin-binding protein 2 [Dehalococcoidia bacterium]|nr:penicillin-binding protein 2 [Dehalococcoidia bacterium]